MANQNIKQRAEKNQNANIYSQTQLGLFIYTRADKSWFYKNFSKLNVFKFFI
jgi:hypothetical protein